MIFNFLQFIRESQDQVEIDRILDKILSSGVDSLSKDERSYLDGNTGANEVGIDLYNNEYIDKFGNYLDTPIKSNFILKVKVIDGYIEIDVYEKSGRYIIDDNFSDIFTELRSIGIDDISEGSMVYNGKLDFINLISKLKSMGFNVIKK